MWSPRMACLRTKALDGVLLSLLGPLDCRLAVRDSQTLTEPGLRAGEVLEPIPDALGRDPLSQEEIKQAVLLAFDASQLPPEVFGLGLHLDLPNTHAGPIGLQLLREEGRVAEDLGDRLPDEILQPFGAAGGGTTPAAPLEPVPARAAIEPAAVARDAMEPSPALSAPE